MKRLIYILLCMTLFSSCYENIIEDDLSQIQEGFDVPKTEKTEQYEIRYQYKKDVIVFDESVSDYIERVEADTIIYFSSQLPEKYVPKINGIISSRISPKLPYGLGNRVLSFEKELNSYKCITTSASLDDIFEELDIRASFELIDSTSDGFYDDDGVYWETLTIEDAETRGSIGSSNILTINIVDTDATLYANGTFSVGAIATIDISLEDNWSECSLEFIAGMNGEIGAKKSWEGYKRIFKKENLVNGVLSIGPVVLRPYIDVDLGLQGTIEGNISTSFSKQFGIKAGVINGKTFHKNTTTKANSNMIENISVDAKGYVGLVCELNFGAGLYTKNIALGIEPTVYAGFGTDLQLNNPNIFRNAPQLDFNVIADVDIEFFAQFFGKELMYTKEKLASVGLFSYSWPLLPILVENTLDVEKRDAEGPLTFDAKYNLKGGLLGKFMNISPSFRVYKGGDEIYHIVDDKCIGPDETNEFKFELTDLEHDISYTGKPCILFMGNIYDEDGIPFSSTSPTAAITDIVQTGSAEGSFTYKGENYDYEFYFYVNMEIRGSDNCLEWGLYNPNSEVIYNPNELKDGRVTQYWTALSNNGSVTVSETPYVILKENGDYKYFETHSHTLYHGGATRSIQNQSSNNIIKMRLDSIRYERY
ncbi:MAG: hypothetical protein J6U91_03445 [Alistipes sp.]|nr:hypothetical protein [Alistipes sp.]